MNHIWRKAISKGWQATAGGLESCVSLRGAGRIRLNDDITETYDLLDEGRLERMAKMAICLRFATVLRGLMARSHSRATTDVVGARSPFVCHLLGFLQLDNFKADLGRCAALRTEFRVGV